LAYVRRYKLTYSHPQQAKALIKILQTEKWPTINSWMQIYELSKTYRLLNYAGQGCAILKIGYMLQELNVLPPRSDEYGVKINAQLNLFDPTSKPTAENFANALLGANKAQATVHAYLYNLTNLERWAKTLSPTYNLMNLNQALIEKHLLWLANPPLNCNVKRLEGAISSFIPFYRYLEREKKILKSPCASIKRVRGAKALKICSPEQLRKLAAFLKNEHSNPEEALLITLVLIMGLTIGDLSHAQLSPENSERITIVLRRKPCTYGRHYYNRPQILHLPTHPPWFVKLQRRFYCNWRVHYSKVKWTYPRYPLILSQSFHSNRPISVEQIRLKIARGTLAATGATIPTPILRQTCGHLHTKKQDASTLTHLGWSPLVASFYTWLPRNYYVPKKIKKLN